METRDEELIQDLLPGHPDLKEAYEEHVKLKEQVDGLKSRSHLSPDEEIEKKDLQKRKLVQKDKVLTILSEYRRSHTAQQHA